MTQMKSEIRDGMRIEWDAPIPMDDGVVLRADVFRPVGDGRYPVILSYGPYGKGLAFQEGYKSAWTRLIAAFPEVLGGVEQQVPEVGAGRSGEMGAGRLCDACASTARGAGRSPGHLDPWSPREAKDIYDCVEWAGTPALEQRQGRHQRHLLLRDEPVARGALQPPHLAAICVWEARPTIIARLTRHGGILCDFLSSWYRAPGPRVQHGVGERGPEPA